MTTGDILNNVRKMKAKLKAIKYSGDVNIAGITEGSAAAYLPIYHYAFTVYSTSIANLLLDKDVQLYGKSDAKFMESIYKILRDLFAYKPPITKEQFFAKGFAERKVIMCTEILDLVKTKHMKLNPGPSKTTMKTGVRPKSADPKLTENTSSKSTDLASLFVPKTKGNSGKYSPRDKRFSSGSSAVNQALMSSKPCPPTVVNELVAPPPAPPTRHVSFPSVPPVRHVAGHHEPPSFCDRSDTSSDCSTPEKPESRPYYNQFNTPSIKKACLQSAEVVVMPRQNKGLFDESQEKTLEPSILEIQGAGDSMLQTSQAADFVTREEYQLLLEHQTMMNERLAQTEAALHNQRALTVLLENRLAILESKMNGPSSCNKCSSKQASPPVKFPFGVPGGQSAVGSSISGSSFSSYQDTTTSSTLMETQSDASLQRPPAHSNHRKPVHVERSFPVASKPASSGMSTQFVTKSRPEAEIANNGRDIDLPAVGPTMFSGPGSSFSEELEALCGQQSQSAFSHVKNTADLSLNYSPIRRTVNGIVGQLVSANEDTFAQDTEEDARRSSTPTQLGPSLCADSSLHCNFSDLDTQNQALRINQMLKETMKLTTAATDDKATG